MAVSNNCLFTPIFGEMIPIDDHIFSDGWVQPPTRLNPFERRCAKHPPFQKWATYCVGVGSVFVNIFVVIFFCQDDALKNSKEQVSKHINIPNHNLPRLTLPETNIFALEDSFSDVCFLLGPGLFWQVRSC